MAPSVLPPAAPRNPHQRNLHQAGGMRAVKTHPGNANVPGTTMPMSSTTTTGTTSSPRPGSTSTTSVTTWPLVPTLDVPYQFGISLAPSELVSEPALTEVVPATVPDVTSPTQMNAEVHSEVEPMESASAAVEPDPLYSLGPADSHPHITNLPTNFADPGKPKETRTMISQLPTEVSNPNPDDDCLT